MDALFSHFTTSEPDLFVHTSRGKPIPAHKFILASASPFLEKMVTSSNRIVKIPGIRDAVIVFLHFLYTSRCSEEDMKNYGIHLLVLSHAYSVKQLKAMCVISLSENATTENVVDLLHLSRLCDAPDLYLKCVNFIANRFKAVQETEGWKFLHKHDPSLELDILFLIDENKSRKKRGKKQREQQKLFVQLGEAMECLEHICTEGCTQVTPYDVEQKNKPCAKFATCQGLQKLIRHFATCKRRSVKGGCLLCKRMWQLFRLHSCICLHDCCKVPLCRQIQLKKEKEKKVVDDEMWELLVSKVASAKAMSSLPLPKTKLEMKKI